MAVAAGLCSGLATQNKRTVVFLLVVLACFDARAFALAPAQPHYTPLLLRLLHTGAASASSSQQPPPDHQPASQEVKENKLIFSPVHTMQQCGNAA